MIDKNDILKYLDGRLNEKRSAILRDLIETDDSVKKEFELSKCIFDSSNGISDFKQFDLNDEWATFQANVQQIEEKVDQFTAVEKSNVIPLQPKKSNSQFYSNISIAASLLILVAALFVFWPAEKFIEVTAIEDMEIELGDGTIAELKKDAYIKTLKNYDKESSREVYVTGEAIFDVVSNPEKPFVVKSQISGVKVLGTVFLVKADEASSEVENISGKVRFFDKTDESKFMDLNPGDKIKFDGKAFTNLNPPTVVVPEPEVEPETKGYKAKDFIAFIDENTKYNFVIGDTVKQDSNKILELEDLNNIDLFNILEVLDSKGIKYVLEDAEKVVIINMGKN